MMATTKYTPLKFGDTAGLELGDKIYVTVEDVTATATFFQIVAGIKNWYVVILDGTNERIKVPGWTITKQPDWKAHRAAG